MSHSTHLPDSRYAIFRLVVALLIMTMGSSSMYVVSVLLPAVQAEFGVPRAQASLPYTFLMLGFGLGGVIMGRMADRFGVRWPLLVGAISLGLGFTASGFSTGILSFTVIQALLVGAMGSATTFGPLIADTMLWFARRRGIAVAVCASGNYLSGAIWPPIVEVLVERHGWRHTYMELGVFCGVTMFALALLMRGKPPATAVEVPHQAHRPKLVSDRPFGLSPGMVQGMLCVAGVACCVAMAMPQVHIVAYCGDLGYGVARGAQMLSVMLGFGIVSRLVSGLICDRIGGLRTLLLGTALQCVALLLFLPFDGLVSLYVISALFGLFQGGIVPSYAIVVREYFPASEAGARVGAVMMSTLLGMALGGWMSGKVFDLTGSYQAAFLNGIGWNLLNMTIVATLLFRARRSLRAVTASRVAR
ncbi:L-lactate transporter [Paraburkholderia caffeinitolerans]|uniref:L-lactate transporter n=1 Tax=Paraburkholderia caffeinitolerans TaxID=1723730 RepID=A0A6J5GQK7_9BURK|nr:MULTISPECIES: MFS transporter [Paraburkholderia]CAB3805439.1 L-lactate transporter [Paraburkholderia caffeinitolerans]